jgi:hypothetical protein
MATRNNQRGAPALPTPQQPGLRAFIVYKHLPAGCIAFPITTNDSVPHLRKGDIAVVDTQDREGAERELFVIEWGRNAPRGPKRFVVELWTRLMTRPGGEKFVGWWAGAYSRPRSHEEAMARAQRTGIISGLVDGPYAHRDYPHPGDPQADYLPSLLIGRVVGILEPSFEEPKRISGSVEQ